MIKIRNKRGQVALFVIIALVIAGIVLVFFAFLRGPGFAKAVEFSPRQYMETCVKSAVNEVTGKMIPQAGLLEPKNYVMYNYSKAPFMCEEAGYFKPCVNQHPMLLNEIKTEIYDYIKPRIENCFSAMKKEAEGKNWGVEYGPMNFSVALAPGSVIVIINRETILSGREGTQTVKEYNIAVDNRIYDLANVVLDITSAEAKRCSFSAVNYMMTYPKFNIQNTVLDDSTKIYFVKDRLSGGRMMFAIRGCAMIDM